MLTIQKLYAKLHIVNLIYFLHAISFEGCPE